MSPVTLANSWHPSRHHPDRIMPMFRCPRCDGWLTYAVARPQSISTLVCQSGCGTFRYHHRLQLLRCDNRHEWHALADRASALASNLDRGPRPRGETVKLDVEVF